MNEVTRKREYVPFTGDMLESILVLVDVSNIYLSARENYGYDARVDFRKLRDIALKPSKRRFKHIMCRAYFAAIPDQLPTGFIFALEKIGYEVVVTSIRTHEFGSPSATNVDVELAKDAVSLKINGKDPEIVVVASGDGDFANVYRDLKARGTRVEVMSFPPSLSSEVMDVVDEVTKLGREHLFEEYYEKGSN